MRHQLAIVEHAVAPEHPQRSRLPALVECHQQLGARRSGLAALDTGRVLSYEENAAATATGSRASTGKSDGGVEPDERKTLGRPARGDHHFAPRLEWRSDAHSGGCRTRAQGAAIPLA